MNLYHGTSTEHWWSIQLQGLHYPYLTNSLELAQIYAKEDADTYQGEAIVLEVAVEESNLRYDGNSMNEPVAYQDMDTHGLYEKVKKTWKRAAIAHPEWVKDGMIFIPESHYQLSLQTVGACRYEGVIPIEKIILLAIN